VTRACRRRILSAAALSGIAACTAMPRVDVGHPRDAEPANPFSMAQRRCSAQGKEPTVSYREPIPYVHVGNQPVYRGATIVCE
jgi:hypothetical protein